MSNKVYDCTFIIGRFQSGVPHIGHEHIIDTARKMSDRTLIFIGSATELPSLRNPYSITTRINMMRELYDDPNVIIAPLPDLTSSDDESYAWGEYLTDNIDKHIYKQPDCMVYGLSEEEQGRATRWFDTKKASSMSFMMVPRQTVPISGTMIREIMIQNNRKEWMKWVNPKFHKYYDILREELMRVPECKELEKQFWIEQSTTSTKK